MNDDPHQQILDVDQDEADELTTAIVAVAIAGAAFAGLWAFGDALWRWLT